MSTELIELIQGCIRDLREQQGQTGAPEPAPDTRLFGEKGLFDSVGLVSLVVSVEEAIEDKYGKSVSLADQKAMSQKHSPYRSVQTLADYAAKLVHGGA